MKQSEELLQTAGETFEYARQYARQKVEYHKLDLAGRMAKMTSFMITFIIAIFLIGMLITFLSIGLALLIGQLLNSLFWGFIIMAGVFFAVACIVYIFRKKWITNPLLSVLLNELI